MTAGLQPWETLCVMILALILLCTVMFFAGCFLTKVIWRLDDRKRSRSVPDKTNKTTGPTEGGST